MQEVTGRIRKMRTALGAPVRYTLPFDAHDVEANTLIGQEITIQFGGRICCLACDRRTRKSYGQGYCWRCFRKVPQVAECILRPELCRGHEGHGRDAGWEAHHHVQPHAVYLAVSGGLKVGVTRLGQIPTRWIDQGADSAIQIAETPWRQLAGLIEVACKEHFSDRTPWQRMLRGERPEGVDLAAERDRALDLLPEELAQYGLRDSEPVAIDYPLAAPPEAVKGISLDREPLVTGTLLGIRGQYLIFEGGRALNVRRHAGYVISASW